MYDIWTAARKRLTANRILTIWLLGIVGVYLFFWYQQAALSGWCNDEAAHIPSGLYTLQTGLTDAYRVNPHLPRVIAAIPLQFFEAETSWYLRRSPFDRIEFTFANDWVRKDLSAIPRLLLVCRSTNLLFVLVGLLSIGRWAYCLYGPRAAWVACASWVLNPDILVHSAAVGPDLPAASAGLMMGYSYWNWMVQKERSFPWWVAVCVAFATLCKFSWLFLFFALPAVTLVFDFLARRGSKALIEHEARPNKQPLSFYQDSIRLGLSFSFAVLLINAVYGFGGSFSCLGDFRFISQSLTGGKLAIDGTGNRFVEGAFANLPVPLPSDMLLGIDFLRWEFESGMESYLCGRWNYGGWWYFYLYAMAVKMPLGYWLLIGLGIGSLIWDRLRKKPVAQLEWLPLLLAVMFIALISSQTGFTHHVRYVLPAYGFLFILASRVMVVFPKRIAFTLVAVCLSGTIWFHTTHLGLAHTFFNPLAGGPNNGWRHLSFSNVDWGQSTYRMVDWVKEHPQQRPMTVLFVSSLGRPEQLVADQKNVFTSAAWRQARNDEYASPTRSGFYLISSFQMTLPQNRFFWDQKPIDQPRPDMLLFYLSEDDVAGFQSR